MLVVRIFLPLITFLNSLSTILKPVPVLHSLWQRIIRFILPLDEASLMNAARRKTGLRDFGNDRFLVPFRLLLEDLEESANLHLFGRYVAREEILVRDNGGKERAGLEHCHVLAGRKRKHSAAE